jgi:hypothetical protein
MLARQVVQIEIVSVPGSFDGPGTAAGEGQVAYISDYDTTKHSLHENVLIADIRSGRSTFIETS